MEENTVLDYQPTELNCVRECGLFNKQISMAMIHSCTELKTGSYMGSVFCNFLVD